MNHAGGCSGRVVVAFLAALAVASGLVARVTPLAAAVDTSQYMSPDEIERGMKGFGRTVMAGTDYDCVKSIAHIFSHRQNSPVRRSGVSDR